MKLWGIRRKGPGVAQATEGRAPSDDEKQRQLRLEAEWSNALQSPVLRAAIRQWAETSLKLEQTASPDDCESYTGK
jgi:hypothetical protein